MVTADLMDLKSTNLDLGMGYSYWFVKELWSAQELS